MPRSALPPTPRSSSHHLTHLLATGLLASLGACAPPASEAPPALPDTTEDAASHPAETEGALFVDRAVEVGLDFVHFNGMTGDFVYSELMAGGSALFDYDNDGDLDVYVTQGRLLGRDKTFEDAIRPKPEGPLVDRLYRNDLQPGRPESLAFTDVTAEAGLDMDGYSMGVVAGDIDNDSFTDLYVTEWDGPNRLLRNRGDGSFEDITERSGTGDTRWSVAAALFDADRDGLLDLYVANYLDFSMHLNRECVNDVGLRDYCGPVAFKPVPDVFFRNLGGGRFADATGPANVLQSAAPGLGVVTGDWNDDGWTDVYVANDAYPNNLLLGRGDGSFKDEARLSGVAMNAEGLAEAGMGVAAGDFDNDGDEDLFVAHLNQETNTLYESQPDALFSDRTAMSGLATASYDFTGFGTGFLDIDNDGLLDLLVVNGAVQGIRELAAAGDPFPLHQSNLVWRNADGRFEDVTARAGAALERSEVSRGAALGDLDNDGDTDVLVHNNSGPLRLWINQVGQDAAWLGLRLVGPSGRDMHGAEVELSAPGRRQMRRVRTEGSYASSNDPRVLFGLAAATASAEVTVTWPDGSRESWSDLSLRVYHSLTQGGGRSTP